MNRWALMVGINEYPNLAPQFQLKGCVNDQETLRRLLVTRFGFALANIAFFTNQQATRATILRELDRLAGMGAAEGQSPVAEGDLVVISYTGHGSKLREPEGQRDEVDGLDSTLVPSDSDRPAPVGRGGKNLEITDDELFVRFQRIRERIGAAGHLVLYFDCCHSGTMSRDLDDDIGRTLPPAEEGYDDVERLSPFVEGGRSIEAKGASGWLPLNEGYILIAGCADAEVAREYRDPATNTPYGALTFFLTQEMARATGTLTYRDLFQRAQAQVTARFPAQHPQMEGDWNRPLFGTEAVEVEPFALVEAREGDTRLRLAAGAAQGATVGSRWAILPPDLADRRALAEVTIREVQALSSVAESDAPLPAEVTTACRAVETEHAWGDWRVAVAVDGADSAALEPLREQVRQSALLRLAERGSVEMVAVLLPARDRVDPEGDFAPELGPLTEPTWAIVGRDRALMPMPPHATSEANALADTFANLETWARAMHVRQLAPRGRDPLQGKFKVGLRRFQPGASPESFEDEPTRRLPQVRAGERIVLELQNDADQPLFFVIYDIGLLGRVARLYPPSGAVEAIPPRGRVTLAGRGELPISLPDRFPAALDGATETLKIMVTTQPADFDTLTQEGARSLDAEIPLFAISPLGSRDLSFTTPIADEATDNGWTAETLDFYVTR